MKGLGVLKNQVQLKERTWTLETRQTPGVQRESGRIEQEREFKSREARTRKRADQTSPNLSLCAALRRQKQCNNPRSHWTRIPLLPAQQGPMTLQPPTSCGAVVLITYLCQVPTKGRAGLECRCVRVWRVVG